MATEMHYRKEEKEEAENWLVGYTLVENDAEKTVEVNRKKCLPDNVQTEANNNSSNVSIENDKDFKKDSKETKPPKFVSVWIINNNLEFLPEEEEKEEKEDLENEVGIYYHGKDYRDLSSSDDSTASESSEEESKSSDEQYVPSSSEDESTSEDSDD